MKPNDRRRRVGTLVRMSARLKRKLASNGSEDHLKEFGGCVGAVMGPMFPEHPHLPEVDVRWHPSGLRYGYDFSDLVLVRESLRVKDRI